MELKQVFIHHVFFWLKNPTDQNDMAQLEKGLRSLTEISTIKSFHIGKPAATNRGVIDNTYSLSWMIFFDNAADQDSYQVDPVHLKFVEDYAQLWQKVVVYDAI
jgi:hypothetical protein